MKMPKSCLSCPLQGGTADCRLTQKTYNWGLPERPSDCPLVPVPPHGRLIDADAVVAEIDSYIDNMAYSYSYLLREEQSQREHGMVFARDIVRDAPTIIPASEEHTMEEFMYGQEGNPNDGSM
jgi:hypothetical protein